MPTQSLLLQKNYIFLSFIWLPQYQIWSTDKRYLNSPDINHPRSSLAYPYHEWSLNQGPSNFECTNLFDLKVTKSLITRLGPTFSKVWNRDLPILITIPRPTRPLSVIWLWSNYKSSGASHHSPQCEFQNNQCFVVLIKMQFCIKIKPQCKVYELKATAL